MKATLIVLLLASVGRAQSTADSPPRQPPPQRASGPERASEQSRKDRVVARARQRAAQRHQMTAGQMSDGGSASNQAFSASNPAGSQMRGVYTCSPLSGFGL